MQRRTNHSVFGVNLDACKMFIAFNGVDPIFLMKKLKVVAKKMQKIVVAI